MFLSNECVRNKNGKVPDDFDEVYQGTAKDFLLSLNNDKRFERYYHEDEKAEDFVFE